MITTGRALASSGTIKEKMMRAFALTLMLCVLGLIPGSGNAENRLPKVIVSESAKPPLPDPGSETYHGHFLEVSALVGRQDFAAMTESLRRQVDIAEEVPGLSPRVRDFFRSIPISVSELACLNATKDPDGKDLDDPKDLLHLACYGNLAPDGGRIPAYGSVWESGKSRWTNSDPIALSLDTNAGVVMVRPITLTESSKSAQRPVILHELLHAYHSQVLPQGYKNPGILLHYKRAKEKQLYPANAYLMTNEREFFAVTASVFLYGEDGPLSRSMIKEKQPDYYRYLVFLFGFDPDPTPVITPLASTQ
jgi:hypothetical protein